MTDELKPCPFCGKNDSCYVDFDSTCYECQSCGAMCNSLDDWQSRPLEAALQAQVDRLRKAIEIVCQREVDGLTQEEWALIVAALEGGEG